MQSFATRRTSWLETAFIAALVAAPIAYFTALITVRRNTPKVVVCPLCEEPLGYNELCVAHYACGQRFHRECVEMGHYHGRPLNGICVSCALPWKKSH